MICNNQSWDFGAFAFPSYILVFKNGTPQAKNVFKDKPDYYEEVIFILNPLRYFNFNLNIIIIKQKEKTTCAPVLRFISKIWKFLIL